MAGSGQVLVLDTEDPLAVAAVTAIHTGDLPALQRLLSGQPRLATARLGDNDGRPRAACRAPCCMWRPTGRAITRTARRPWRR
jgi:hypothetical protein